VAKGKSRRSSALPDEIAHGQGYALSQHARRDLLAPSPLAATEWSLLDHAPERRGG